MKFENAIELLENEIQYIKENGETSFNPSTQDMYIRYSDCETSRMKELREEITNLKRAQNMLNPAIATFAAPKPTDFGRLRQQKLDEIYELEDNYSWYIKVDKTYKQELRDYVESNLYTRHKACDRIIENSIGALSYVRDCKRTHTDLLELTYEIKISGFEPIILPIELSENDEDFLAQVINDVSEVLINIIKLRNGEL
jgi:hypothetical protein